MLDLLICATRRAEILELTLRSFKSRLFGAHPLNAMINVDPVGPDADSRSVIRTAKKYFDPSFCRCPNHPGFPAAFKALWMESAAPYVFWLEDDWELLENVNLQDMVNIMENFPDLAVLRLPWKPTGKDFMKNWRYFFPWNGRYFECPANLRREVGFCGHPSLIRGEFVRACAPHIDTTRNPEKQFHHGPGEIMKQIDRWRFGVYGMPNKGPFIRDIGRSWILNTGWRKAGNKAHFTHWEKIC
ncbi:hypothetical protein KKH13_05315 [Patescibacteria group bacterium]|uniref:Glycosyltransferase n=1 Tax=viral metagenome TaxID=1070528 RepID=A0A6M3J627_9ZZZZ|nr:hypothetical protein [Patescibacteria group bacterium]